MSAEQYAKRGHTIEIETKISTSRPVCIIAASSKAKSCLFHSIHIHPMLFSFSSLSRKRMTSDSSGTVLRLVRSRVPQQRARPHCSATPTKRRPHSGEGLFVVCGPAGLAEFSAIALAVRFSLLRSSLQLT